MKFGFMIIFLLVFVGCDDVNKEELRALNNYSKKVESKKVELISSPKSVEVVEKSLPEVKNVENNKTIEIVPLVKVKSTNSSNERYKLALAQIQKNRELKEQKNRNFQLSVIKLANENELKLKEKDIDLKKAEVEGSIALAEVELKKVKESEKTKVISAELTHKELLLQNRNQLEKDKQDAIFAKERLEFYKIIAAIVGFLLLIYMVASYLFKSFKEQNRVAINENELTHKMQLKMLEIESKNFEKMLDLVSSGKLSENVENELLSNIRESQNKRILITQKPKRGLVFKQ